eukprot:TRINITY_DN41361_c0_g1_i1.p1 TRINITY_DN41361_c0_g1~~TRINITY_DN41361_c0_g1_i1.p1  ORF type:complete len:246 (+),score=47.37 TRINITY_DN41361_c0_g1_i1:36-740(+)
MPSALVLLVRHGETDGNAQARVQPPSEPLSVIGRQQAAKLGAALKAAEQRGDYHIAVALVSDLARTKETAKGVFDELGYEGRDVRDEALLQERNFGELRGQLYASFAEKYGNVFAEEFAPPGGETWQQFRERVREAWSIITRTAMPLPSTQAGSPEKALLVVTHGLVLKVIAEEFLDLPSGSSNGWRNTSVTAVRVSPTNHTKDSRARVEVANDISHLATDSLNDPALQGKSKL